MGFFFSLFPVTATMYSMEHLISCEPILIPNRKRQTRATANQRLRQQGINSQQEIEEKTQKVLLNQKRLLNSF